MPPQRADVACPDRRLPPACVSDHARRRPVRRFRKGALMGLRAKLEQQLKDLYQENERIETQARENLAANQIKIDALEKASKALTPDVETTYTALLRLGLVKEI